eukprot:6195402-Amphidinium_carterae.1
MPGIGLLRKRISLTSRDLPGCPASPQAVYQPNTTALGAEHELRATSTYLPGVGLTSRGKRMRSRAIAM